MDIHFSLCIFFSQFRFVAQLFVFIPTDRIRCPCPLDCGHSGILPLQLLHTDLPQPALQLLGRESGKGISGIILIVYVDKGYKQSAFRVIPRDLRQRQIHIDIVAPGFISSMPAEWSHRLYPLWADWQGISYKGYDSSFLRLFRKSDMFSHSNSGLSISSHGIRKTFPVFSSQ